MLCASRKTEKLRYGSDLIGQKPCFSLACIGFGQDQQGADSSWEKESSCLCRTSCLLGLCLARQGFCLCRGTAGHSFALYVSLIVGQTRLVSVSETSNFMSSLYIRLDLVSCCDVLQMIVYRNFSVIASFRVKCSCTNAVTQVCCAGPVLHPCIGA